MNTDKKNADAEKLYSAIKSGKVKIGDLNDAGKKLLTPYIETKVAQRKSATDSNALQKEKLSMVKAQPERTPSVNKPDVKPVNTGTSRALSDMTVKNMGFSQTYQPPEPPKIVAKTEKNSQPPNYLQQQQLNEANGKWHDLSLPGRNVPVLGEVLRAADSLARSKAQHVVADVGQMVYTPGAGMANVAGFMQGAGNAVSRIAPKLDDFTVKGFGAGKVATEAIKEGAVGAPVGFMQSLAQDNDLGTAVKHGAYGAALGAAGGGLVTGAGPAINAASSGVKKLAGNADNWFTAMYGEQGVGITPFGSQKRIGKTPIDTKDSIVSKALRTDSDSVMSDVAARARQTYQNFVDSLSPLKKVSQETYETAIDAARANNIANNIIGKDFVTPEGIRIGDGLETIFKKVGRGQDKDFIDYLVLRDAETRVARGERVYDESLGMTPEKIAQRIKRYDATNPKFAAIAQDWDTFTKNLRITFGLNEGLLNEAQIAAMEASRPKYTPMRRQFSKSEKPGRNWVQSSTGASFSGQKAPIKKVSPTGSVRGIVDPRKTMIEAVGAWSNAAMRNRVGMQILNVVKENPQAFKDIIEIVPDGFGTTNKAQATQKSIDDINEIIKNDGMEGLIEKLNNDFEVMFRKGSNSGTTDNVVTFMDKGNPIKVAVKDPEVFKAIMNLGPQQSGLIVDVLSMFANATKRGATGALAPLFAARSVTVDLVQALIQSKNPVRHSVDLVHAIFSSIGDKFNIPGLRNLAVEFRRSGGEYSAALRGERQLNKGLGRLKRDPILSPENLARQTWNVVKSPFAVGEAISDVSENINRIAAYKSEMRRLGGERTPENVRKAITAGREITTNFSRKGAYAKELEALFPYQNAAVQGTYRIMKGFKDNPVKTTSAVFALAIGPKLFEYSQFHDDPDYQKLPMRERVRNLIVSKNEDGTFVKVPMDPAYNSFGQMTIATMQYLKENDPQAFKGMSDALANAWTPPLVTGALQGVTQGTGPEGSGKGLMNAMSTAPLNAVLSNQSFTGAPIVPQRMEGNSPEYQYDERTSKISKWIGQKTGLSPMKTDYLIKAYGGDPARIVLPLMSDAGAGTPRNTLLKNFIADPVFTNTLSNDFYTASDAFTQAKNDHEDFGKDLPEWYSEDLYKLVASKAKDKPLYKISALTTQKRTINGNTNLSAKEKADQLRNIQAQINDIYAEVNSQLANRGFKFPNR